MTAKWHRALAALAVGIAGIGGLIGLTDPDGLGISASAWEVLGNWLSLGAGVVGVGITVVRSLSDSSPPDGAAVTKLEVTETKTGE